MNDIEKIIDERLSDLERSKREELNFFAAHAPEQIPAWFERMPADQIGMEILPAPKEPRREDQIFADDPDLMREAESWRKDGTWDLEDSTNERLREFAISWRKFWNDRTHYDKNKAIRKYFAWRWYYAKMMINERPEI